MHHFILIKYQFYFVSLRLRMPETYQKSKIFGTKILALLWKKLVHFNLIEVFKNLSRTLRMTLIL